MDGMNLYTDQALTTFSQAWQNDDADLIIPKLLPRIPVIKNSGTFPIWGKDALIIQPDLTRTGKAKTREIGLNRSTGTWGPLTEKALKMFIDNDQYRLYPTVFEPEAAGVNILNKQMALNEEYTGANVLTNPAVITNNIALTSTNNFSNTSVDPIKTITDQIQLFQKSAFKAPNTLAMGQTVWYALVNHPAVIERFKYSQAGIVSMAEIMRCFEPYGITQILIGKAQGTVSTTENAADTSYEYLWGDNLLITYVTPTPGLMEVNGGYTLEIPTEKYVDKWPERDPKGNYIRNNDYYLQVIFSTDVYYLMTNCL